MPQLQQILVEILVELSRNRLFFSFLSVTSGGGTIEQEVNANHKRHLSPTFTFTDLPHHRTCGSAYGGFGLSHLTMCGKLFSAIPLTGVTSILLSDSVLSSEQRVPFGHLTTKESQGSSHLLCTARFCPSPQAHVPQVLWLLLTSHGKRYSVMVHRMNTSSLRRP